jgi:uncharacterized protein YjiS (DUF1127 family)
MIFPKQESFAMREYALNQADQEFYGSLFGNLRRSFRNWRKRQMLKQVHDLDDYILKDIGLDRHEVADVLHLSLDYDPIAELHRRAEVRRRIGDI